MNCHNCMMCKNLVAVSSVASTGGVTTLTVPDTFEPQNMERYCFGLFNIELPANTMGTQINITNGTDTWEVYNRLANYWRPRKDLYNGGILKLGYLNDPAHFLRG